jgi:hypothetical protein
VNRFLRIALLGLALVVQACGDADRRTVEGFHVPDEQFCKLRIGLTTWNQAIELIGSTDDRTQSASGGLLIYWYIVIDGPNVVTTESVTLYFDENQVLTEVSVGGRDYPVCE